MNNEISFLMYSLDEENVSVNVRVSEDTIWMTQNALAELFGIDRTGVGRHLKNIFEEGELDKEVVCANFAHTTKHGAIEGKEQVRDLKYYNLDAIISVGYRINSKKATAFRIWATNVLKEYMIKGFAMDDDRLKQGTSLFGNDYFKELLERIRDIRSSEKIFYRQVLDLFATSIDYDGNSEEAKKVYEKDLKYIDKDAFTPKGVIQSYEISSFEKNPMGGIIVYLFVNDHKEYTVSVFLHKNDSNGKLVSGGGSWSPQLE